MLAKQTRELLGSRESIGHLRVSSYAVEFDLFARNNIELEGRKKILETKIGRLLTLRLLDQPFVPKDRIQVLREGITLFNEERFWECHEVLEQIWHPAKGLERNILQGLIQTAAAFVHHQKAEDDTCLSMLRKAQIRLLPQDNYEGIDLKRVRGAIERILLAKRPEVFQIPL